MKVALIAGGSLDERFVLDFLKEWDADKIIGVDRGLLFLYEHQIAPSLIVGDFDSLPEGILEHYQHRIPIRRWRPEKDATDMEIGIREAIEMGADTLALLGGTGSRMDHVLGNIQALMIPLEQGVHAFIQDKHNRIQLLNQDKTIQKKHMFGKYVSFFPLTTVVKHLTLQGFRYPLNDYTLTGDNSLCVSNEVTEEEARISFQDGVLIMIEAND